MVLAGSYQVTFVRPVGAHYSTQPAWSDSSRKRIPRDNRMRSQTQAGDADSDDLD